ncbi:MAG: hypothetical protein U9N35_05310 [Euryarchaeota archaeon]|nr:hypothetical protein [Euryarchaeota archaeon]
MRNIKNDLTCIGLIAIVLFSLGCIGEKSSETISPKTETVPPAKPSSNSPPVAKFSMHPENPRDTERVMFHNESGDPDKDALNFEWYIDGEYDCSCFSISEKFAKGEHAVKIIAEDTNSSKDEYEATFYVSETFIEEDISELVLRREDIGLSWNPIDNESLGENSYHTIFKMNEKKLECIITKYETVEAAKERFKEILTVELSPHNPIGNEATYKTSDKTVEVRFRYGNLICTVSMNTDNLNDVLSHCRSLEAKLNQVG